MEFDSEPCLFLQWLTYDSDSFISHTIQNHPQVLVARQFLVFFYCKNQYSLAAAATSSLLFFKYTPHTQVEAREALESWNVASIRDRSLSFAADCERSSPSGAVKEIGLLWGCTDATLHSSIGSTVRLSASLPPCSVCIFVRDPAMLQLPVTLVLFLCIAILL